MVYHLLVKLHETLNLELMVASRIILKTMSKNHLYTKIFRIKIHFFLVKYLNIDSRIDEFDFCELCFIYINYNMLRTLVGLIFSPFLIRLLKTSYLNIFLFYIKICLLTVSLLQNILPKYSELLNKGLSDAFSAGDDILNDTVKIGLRY